MKRTLWIIALVLLPATAVVAQVAEEVQVTLVEVPVTVVDRDGNPLRGLTKENFELSDDGKKVPIEYFEVLDLPELAAKKRNPAEPLPPAATRHFVLMFDLANSSPGTIHRAGEAAKIFLQEQLGATDLAAISTFSVETGARMLTNFTRNRKVLADAIETLGGAKTFKPADPLMMSGTTVDSVTGGSVGSANQPATSEMNRDFDTLEQKARKTELLQRLRTQFQNMGSVALALDRLKGQKEIILLSEGFNAALLVGREDLGSQKATTETADVLSGESWKVDNDARYGNTESSRDVDTMVALFRRSDVVLHAIDIKGLRGATDASTMLAPQEKKSWESLYLLTKPTGGAVFKNANDLKENFAKLMKQQEVVYLLGFQAQSGGSPGKFHALKVKALNVKTSRVSHRAGYYEPSKLSALERVLTIGDLMMTDAPVDDIDVDVTALPLPGPSGRARVPVMIELAGPRLLQRLNGSNTATAQLFLYAFDKDSQVVDYVQDRISLDLRQAGDTVRKGGIRYYATLHLPPGDYAIKTAVRVDESSLIGFRRNDLAVPEFKQAAVVPPVLFSDAGNWAMIVGPSRGDNYAYPFAAGESKYIPNGNPTIATGGDYTVALFLANVPLEQVSISPQVVTGGASSPADVKLIGRTSPDETGLYKLLFRFKPANAAAGPHELRFDIATKDGMHSAVSLPFTVQ